MSQQINAGVAVVGIDIGKNSFHMVSDFLATVSKARCPYCAPSHLGHT